MKFVDDFVEYCREFTGCPDAFLKWSAIYALSSVAGSKHIMRRGNWDVKPNLWMLLIGKSSSYKSTGLASVRRLLNRVSPDLIGATSYSYEGFLADMALNSHKCLFFDEAESFFKMLDQKYNAPMRADMMSLYNGQWIQRKIRGREGKGEVYTIEDSYLCMGGASTPTQIGKHLNGSTDEIFTGFLPRFLLVSYFGEDRTVDDPPPSDKDKESRLIETLAQLSQTGEREYTYSPDALITKSKWLVGFKKREASAEERYSSFFKKMRDEHFHKLCILLAFSRGVCVIEKSDILEASKLLGTIESSWSDLLKHFKENEWDRDEQRVAAMVKAEGVISHRDIMRRTQINSFYMDKIIPRLINAELIERADTKPGKDGGRPSKSYAWIIH